MGDLLDACQRATAETLARRGRPVRVMRIAPLDERVMGALMMHFMLETIVASHLLGVDPFDQPAVEDGKVLARQEMEKIGKRSEEHTSELQSLMRISYAVFCLKKKTQKQIAKAR